MATDAALLTSVRLGAPPALRLYRWSPPCLSFGSNQRALGVYERARLRAYGFDVVRRPTGGLAVLHDREITYAVAAPADAFGGVRRSYTVINEALATGLRRLGVAAEVAPSRARMPALAASLPAPCFDRPAAGEVMAEGRKLVGSAQRREGRALLQHGSILLEGEQTIVRDLECTPQPGAPVAHTTLSAVLGSVPDWRAVVDAVTDGFRDCGVRLVPATLSREERARVGALLPRFENDAWTWRR